MIKIKKIIKPIKKTADLLLTGLLLFIILTGMFITSL